MPIGRKRGRPRNARLDLYRDIFKEWSPRTLARYQRAMEMLISINYTKEQTKEILRQATRPNGTMSVARVEHLAELAVSEFVDKKNLP